MDISDDWLGSVPIISAKFPSVHGTDDKNLFIEKEKNAWFTVTSCDLPDTSSDLDLNFEKLARVIEEEKAAILEREKKSYTINKYKISKDLIIQKRRLFLNKRQADNLRWACGVHRWIYNKCVGIIQQHLNNGGWLGEDPEVKAARKKEKKEEKKEEKTSSSSSKRKRSESLVETQNKKPVLSDASNMSAISRARSDTLNGKFENVPTVLLEKRPSGGYLSLQDLRYMVTVEKHAKGKEGMPDWLWNMPAHCRDAALQEAWNAFLINIQKQKEDKSFRFSIQFKPRRFGYGYIKVESILATKEGIKPGKIGQNGKPDGICNRFPFLPGPIWMSTRKHGRMKLEHLDAQAVIYMKNHQFYIDLPIDRNRALSYGHQQRKSTESSSSKTTITSLPISSSSNSPQQQSQQSSSIKAACLECRPNKVKCKVGESILACQRYEETPQQVGEAQDPMELIEVRQEGELLSGYDNQQRKSTESSSSKTTITGFPILSPSNSPQQQEQQPSSIKASSIKAACLECRSNKAKCNVGESALACQRCERFGLECRFEEKPTIRICAIDPGVRTFATVYDPIRKKVYQWGVDDRSKLVRLGIQLDQLIIKKAKAKSRKKCKLRKAVNRLQERISNLINDFHIRFCNWLLTNYDTILYPRLNTQQMSKKAGRRINSKTVRSMMTWAHCKCHDRLAKKVFLLKVTEPYTSKGCGNCGKKKQNLGSSKTFICTDKVHCKYRAERDYNGARNIFMKFFIERVQDAQ